MDRVKEGNYVALMKSFDSGNMKIVAALKDNIVHYGKLHFDTTPLIGCKFGSVFEIKDNTMIEIKDFDEYDSELSTMVSNNMQNFDGKSQFSQEKMIKKKKKSNHSNVLTVIKPNIILINEMFFGRDKIGGLRSDVLAQILTFANVQNGSKCLLLDHNLGLLTGAIMSRILPDGICIQLAYDNEVTTTTRKTLAMLNITEECKGKLFAITIKDFYKVCNGKQNFEQENEILRAKQRELFERASIVHCKRDEKTGEKIKIPDEESLKLTLIKKETNRESRNNERMQAASYLKSLSLDSIVLIAQNEHPLPILKSSLAFLAPSSQFVIYCDIVDPLLECYQYLKSNSLAISVNITESWLRRYQVLPDRTRPEMNSSGYGGYLLSGTKKFLVADGNLNSIPSSSGDMTI